MEPRMNADERRYQKAGMEPQMNTDKHRRPALRAVAFRGVRNGTADERR
jgi:hypothetical protein